jgi:hypothetical protein
MDRLDRDELLPPLGGSAPALFCSYGLGPHCREFAAWHIIWTPQGDNGLACDQHKAETDRRWAYWTAHRYEPVCSTDGARFIIPDDGPSYCFLPDEQTVRTVREAVGLPA